MKTLVSSLKKISEIIKKDVDIIDRDGYVIYSSDSHRAGSIIEDARPNSAILDSRRRLYVFIENGSSEEIGLAQMILKDRVSEGFADNYQQFLINVLDGYDGDDDSCERFGIPEDGEYVVYCINIPSHEHFSDAYSLISNSFYDGKSWVFPYKGDIILMVQPEDYPESVRLYASTVRDMINSEAFTDILIGVGNMHSGVLSIRKSLDEAKEAIKTGRMFNLPDDIFIYRDILAERITAMVPQEKVDELCREVFKDGMEDILDGEMAKTVDVLFKNNLNISDSSRILYIHRNTLLYRIDKIQKATGLDLRKFEDAVTFKLIYLLEQRRKS